MIDTMTAPRFGGGGAVGRRDVAVSKGKQRIARYLGNIAGEAAGQAARRSSAEFTHGINMAADSATARIEDASNKASRKIARGGVIGGAGIAGGLGLGIAGGVTGGAAGKRAVESYGNKSSAPRERVIKSDRKQNNYARLAGVGALTAGAGVGTSLYANNKIKNASAADEKALNTLKYQEHMAGAAYKKTAHAQKKATVAMNSGLKEYDALHAFISGHGPDQQSFRDPASPKEKIKYDRTNATHRAMAQTHIEGISARNRHHPFEAQESWERNNAARTAHENAKAATSGFKPAAAEVTAKYGRIGRKGKIGAAIGAAGMLAGLAGVERSRQYGPKPVKPRFAEQAAVGRKHATDHAKAKGAAYRAGLPAGNMSREQIDSWYVKAPGER